VSVCLVCLSCLLSLSFSLPVFYLYTQTYHTDRQTDRHTQREREREREREKEVAANSLWLIIFLGFPFPGLSPFVFFSNGPIYIFRSWMVLFNYFTFLIVFSYISSRDLSVFSLRASICLPVFSCNFKGVIYVLLKFLYHIMRWDFWI